MQDSKIVAFSNAVTTAKNAQDDGPVRECLQELENMAGSPFANAFAIEMCLSSLMHSDVQKELLQAIVLCKKNIYADRDLWLRNLRDCSLLNL